MKATIQKWGNSLALRIPKAVAAELGLERDSLVDLTMTKRRLVVVPSVRPRKPLSVMLAEVSAANLHGEADLGAPIGREVW